MFEFTSKRRENFNRAMLTVLAVDLANLVFNYRNLQLFSIGCSIVVVCMAAIMTIEK